jgi:hypothetical protein
MLKIIKYIWLMLRGSAITEVIKNWSNEDYFKNGNEVRLSWTIGRTGNGEYKNWSAGLNRERYESHGVKMPRLNSWWADHNTLMYQIIRDVCKLERDFDSLRTESLVLLCWCAVFFYVNIVFNITTQWIILLCVAIVFAQVYVKTKAVVVQSELMEVELRLSIESMEVMLCEGWSSWMSEMLWVEEGY